MLRELLRCGVGGSVFFAGAWAIREWVDPNLWIFSGAFLGALFMCVFDLFGSTYGD